MASSFFVSDIHIENMADSKAGLFLRFLKGIDSSSCENLFLLGDIFDFWIGDHELFVREYEPLIAEFSRLQREKVSLHYFEGNHDLHLKKFWENELGFKVYSEAVHLKLDSSEVRMEHGDQMDPEDKGYLFLRWLLRTPVLTFLAHQLPGFVVAEIGRRSSTTSRAYTSEVKKISDDQAKNKIRIHAEKAYLEKPFDLIISGHVHIRDYYKLTSGAESWNLGTWLDEPGYLEVNKGSAVWKKLE